MLYVIDEFTPDMVGKHDVFVLSFIVQDSAETSPQQVEEITPPPPGSDRDELGHVPSHHSL